MGILIDDRQKKHKLSKTKLQKRAQAILNALGSPEGELSILVVDDSEIKTLNKDYLKRSGPTNVIAFPMKEGDFADINPQLLGDVVISMETAGREALQSGITTEERFAQLLVHGILHLFGFDHETSEQDARKMEKKSNELLKLFESY
ncbi:MAG: rRNA maturation RNase YbeY [Desulfobacterales bacterium]|nr:rRNA maturation RNase YbeY [Desulfobacterales bacterium]MDX2508218.1 rRNA maturation RNase YbeY [Desulfobacterales bacterium]